MSGADPAAKTATGFDRSKAINKLVMLGSEARKLADKMNGLLMPGQVEALNEEKLIKKKNRDHKRALNMLPDADMFRQELLQF